MYDAYSATWQELIAPGADFEIDTIEVRGHPCRIYKNAPNSLRELWLSSKQFGERDYLVYGDERLTYAQAHQHTQSIAAYLTSAGVKPGDRVAIAMRNYPEWLLAYWAITAMGATVVGMNAWWTGPEMHFAMADAAPHAIILDPERLARLSDEDIQQQLCILVRGTDERAVAWGDVITTETTTDGIPDPHIDPDADACIFYTSGTTGRPKGAQLTHRGCVHNVYSMLFAGALLRSLAVKAGTINADDPAPVPASLVTTPLFHVTANNCVAHGTTLAGGKLVHMYKWDAGDALKLIEAEKISGLTGVPVMARELLTHPDFATTDTSTLLSLGGGGAQLQPDLVGKIDETVATARPQTGYGMTETCGIITSIAADFFVDKPDSAGPAMPCYEAKVVNTEGETVPMGETGELWVRGAQVIKGYINRPEATAESIQDGWLRTGDIARLDEHQFIFIVDRLKDMVLRGGENIYCAEVESALYEHSAVAECSVFGIPDTRLGEEVGVAIYSTETISAEELRTHLRELIAAPKIPRYIWLLSEPLPRNASGKFLKRELRETLSPDQAQ